MDAILAGTSQGNMYLKNTSNTDGPTQQPAGTSGSSVEAVNT